MDKKERQARDIAEGLTESKDTDVTPEQITKWHQWDVEEWLEAWGFEWSDGDGWVSEEINL